MNMKNQLYLMLGLCVCLLAGCDQEEGLGGKNSDMASAASEQSKAELEEAGLKLAQNLQGLKTAKEWTRWEASTA
ncbi:MAG: hypothetical protein HC842_07170 [Cytophagales bacterium]|nr:hypothetical protein [Cytophagales bacterium]